MKAGTITEKEFQAQVLNLARLSGWKCYHTFDSRRSQFGFPDLCLCRPPRVLFVELKSMGGCLRPAQKGWLDTLKTCPGVEVYLWRPDMWSQIQEMLR